MSNFLNLILNFFFPPTCSFCGEPNNNFICNNCLYSVKSYSKSSIHDYSYSNYYFNKHFYLFKYENNIRHKILQYKFLDKAYLYKTFVSIFINDKNFCDFIQSYNCITCVPISKKRFKQRGYNQSYLISKELAKYFKIPFYPNLLIKQNNIVAQSSLNRTERFNNIQNAFKYNCKTKSPNMTTPLSIAIFDDIFTTRCNC